MAAPNAVAGYDAAAASDAEGADATGDLLAQILGSPSGSLSPGAATGQGGSTVAGGAAKGGGWWGDAAAPDGLIAQLLQAPQDLRAEVAALLQRQQASGGTALSLPPLPDAPQLPVLPSREEVLEGLLQGLQGQLDAVQADINGRWVCMQVLARAPCWVRLLHVCLACACATLTVCVRDFDGLRVCARCQVSGPCMGAVCVCSSRACMPCLCVRVTLHAHVCALPVEPPSNLFSALVQSSAT